MDKWDTSWEAFVAEVCDLYSAGMSDENVADRFSETPVNWEGVVIISNLRLSPWYVQVRMPRVVRRLSDGRQVIADFLALQIDKEDLSRWLVVKPKSKVRFCTRIKAKVGAPTNDPGIRMCNDIERLGAAYLKIRTEKSAFVGFSSP